MTICKVCEQGGVILGEHIITHDMALDAGDPSLEGQSYGLEWGCCPCCHGYWENCENCSEEDNLDNLNASD